MLHDDGKLSYANLVNSPALSEPWSRIDGWGNPIQYVRNESGELLIENGTVLAYSLGLDGRSESNGNDPDDINCWDTHHRSFYRLWDQKYRDRKRLLRTLWITPLVFISLLIGKEMLSIAHSSFAK